MDGVSKKGLTCYSGNPTGNAWLTEDRQGAGDKGQPSLNYLKGVLSPASCS